MGIQILATESLEFRSKDLLTVSEVKYIPYIPYYFLNHRLITERKKICFFLRLSILVYFYITGD